MQFISISAASLVAEVGGERSADACRASKEEVIYTSYLIVVKQWKVWHLAGYQLPCLHTRSWLANYIFSLCLLSGKVYSRIGHMI